MRASLDKLIRCYKVAGDNQKELQDRILKWSLTNDDRQEAIGFIEELFNNQS